MSKALFRSTTRIECCDAVIRVFDEAGNVLKTHEDAGDFKEWCPRFDPVERACDFAVSSLKLPDIEPTQTNQHKGTQTKWKLLECESRNSHDRESSSWLPLSSLSPRWSLRTPRRRSNTRSTSS